MIASRSERPAVAAYVSAVLDSGAPMLTGLGDTASVCAQPRTDVCRSAGAHKDQVVSVQASPLWFFAITLAPRAQSIVTARRFVREHLSSQGLPMLVDDVVLVASELATNAYAHAGTPFTVSLAAYPDSVIVAVQDGSISSPIHVDAPALSDSGRGIAIVDHVSRTWGVSIDANVGKSVWAEFDVR